MTNVDPVIAAYCGAALALDDGSLPDAPQLGDDNDEFTKLFAYLGLTAGVTQADEFAKGFSLQMGAITKAADAVMGKFPATGCTTVQPAVDLRKASADEWAEEIQPRSDRDSELAKAAVSSGRARHILSLRAWIKKCLARGESVEALVEHAEKHDQEEANLIREAAVGLA